MLTERAGPKGYGTFIAMTKAGGVLTETRRGNGSQLVTVVDHLTDGNYTKSSIKVAAEPTAHLPNAREFGIPTREGATVTDRNRSVPTYWLGGNDSFLEQLSAGQEYALARYITHNNGTDYRGYLTVDKGKATPPSAGSATYTGKAYGYGVGSVTGAQEFEGTLKATANFGAIPADGSAAARTTLAGTISDIRASGESLGFELALQPGGKPVNPEGAFDGTIRVTQPGGAAWVSADMKSSYFIGDFHGDNSAELTGRFEFEVLRAPTPPTSAEVVQDYQGVGVFGGAKQ